MERSGHSTLFVKWVDGFDARRSTNSFWGLGGNQGDRVQLKPYTVTTAHSYSPGNGSHIFWKASGKAYGELGYPDGFGDTRDEAVPPHSIR